MSNRPGLFIAIEGIDYSGKTTQVKLISKKLEEKGYDVIFTSEPTKGRIGQLCRVYLRDSSTSSFADALLFAADRVEHYFIDIEKMVSQGKIVITDRYVASSIAYQSAQGAQEDWILSINSMVPKADLSFYLDIEVDVAIKRLRNSKREIKEKFETVEYLEKVRNNYLNLTKDWLIRIPAERRKEEITSDLLNRVLTKLNLND